MESLISSNIAKLIMENLKTSKINYIKLFTKHLNDLFVIIPANQTNDILNMFSSYQNSSLP